MKPHGHRTSILGTPPFVRSGMGGNRPASTISPRPAPLPHDRQREAVAERDRERARRALWLGCERAPLAIVKGISK